MHKRDTERHCSLTSRQEEIKKGCINKKEIKKQTKTRGQREGLHKEEGSEEEAADEQQRGERRVPLDGDGARHGFRSLTRFHQKNKAKKKKREHGRSQNPEDLKNPKRTRERKGEQEHRSRSRSRGTSYHPAEEAEEMGETSTRWIGSPLTGLKTTRSGSSGARGGVYKYVVGGTLCFAIGERS